MIRPRLLLASVCLFSLITSSLAQAQLAQANMPGDLGLIQNGPQRGGHLYAVSQNGTPFRYFLGLARASLRREDPTLGEERIVDQLLAANPGRILFHAHRNGRSVLCRNGSGSVWSRINVRTNCGYAMPAASDLQAEAPSRQTFCQLSGCSGREIWTVNSDPRNPSLFIVPGAYHETALERVQNAQDELQSRLDQSGSSPQTVAASAQSMSATVEALASQPDVSRTVLLTTIRLNRQAFDRLAEAPAANPAAASVASTPAVPAPTALPPSANSVPTPVAAASRPWWRDNLGWLAAGGIFLLFLVRELQRAFRRSSLENAWVQHHGFVALTPAGLAADCDDARALRKLQAAWPSRHQTLDPELLKKLVKEHANQEKDLVPLREDLAVCQRDMKQKQKLLIKTHERAVTAALERNDALAKLATAEGRLKQEFLERFEVVLTRLGRGSKQIASYLKPFLEEADRDHAEPGRQNGRGKAHDGFLVESVTAIRHVAEEFDRFVHEAIESLESRHFALEFEWHPATQPAAAVISLKEYMACWTENEHLAQENRELRLRFDDAPAPSPAKPLTHSPFERLTMPGPAAEAIQPSNGNGSGHGGDASLASPDLDRDDEVTRVDIAVPPSPPFPQSPSVPPPPRPDEE